MTTAAGPHRSYPKLKPDDILLTNLVISGLSNAQIAKRQGVSVGTVSTKITRLQRKIAISCTLREWLRKQGLLK